MSSPPQDRPTVAVLVVHGVSDPLPGDSARAITDRLVERGHGTFLEHHLRIGMHPVPCEPRPPPQVPWWRRSERARYLARMLGGATSATAADTDPLGDASLASIEDQLGAYAARPVAPRTLDTVRFEGRVGDHDVHVHEVWWADLSRPRSGLLRLVFDIYAVVLHLPNLGRAAVDQGWYHHRCAKRDEAGWWLWSCLQRWAVRALVLGLPALLIAGAAIGSQALPLKAVRLAQAARWLDFVPLAVLVVLAVLVAGLVGLVRDDDPPWWRYPPALPSGVLVGAFAAIWALTWFAGAGPLVWLAILWSAVATLAGLVVGAGYDRVQPGALPATAAALAAANAAFAVVLGWNGGAGLSPIDRVSRSALETVALVWSAGWATWGVIVVLGSLSVVVGVVIAARDGVWRLVWLCGVSLALPASVFLLLSLTFASALRSGAVPAVCTDECHAAQAAPGAPDDPPQCRGPARGTRSAGDYLFPTLPQPAFLCLWGDGYCVLPGSDGLPCPQLGARGVVDRLITAAATGWLVAVGGVLAVLAAFVAVALWPSVVEEIRPSPTRWRPTMFHGRPLARWLSGGFWLVEGVAFAAALALATIAVLAAIEKFRFGRDAGVRFDTMFLSATGAGVLALIGKPWIGAIGRGFDLLLDVDSYLREHPEAVTPRARIAERFWSLVHHLRAWRHPLTGAGYDRIVVVAHSQGTVISADVLRFRAHWLRRAGAPADQPPLALITMGSPLRQLYHRFLPHLYGWVGAGPTCAELGVVRWVNLSCAGDYIGRRLWKQASDDRLDVDLGPGAHTHYWDGTHDDVARWLEHVLAGKRGAPADEPAVKPG